jgi:hypothetical protein
VRPPVKALCPATLEKEIVEIARTLEIRRCRQRTTRSFDSVLVLTTGLLNLAMVLASGICPKPHVGVSSASNEWGARDVGEMKSRLINLLRPENYGITLNEHAPACFSPNCRTVDGSTTRSASGYYEFAVFVVNEIRCGNFIMTAMPFPQFELQLADAADDLFSAGFHRPAREMCA